MVQYGSGSQLAAQCPPVPVPDGLRPWVADRDGPVPDSIARRAQAMAADPSVPTGATEIFPLPGVVATVRVEPHVWGRDAAGTVTEGCFRVGTVYLPDARSVVPPSVYREGPWTRAAAMLTVLTITGGILATVIPWSPSKRR